MERGTTTTESDCYLCSQASIFVRHAHGPRKNRDEDELTTAIRTQARMFAAVYTDSSKLEPLELAIPEPTIPNEDDNIPKHLRDLIASVYVERFIR